jgi:uncharacterized membrane protein YtjA (UPF0391 family)
MLWEPARAAGVGRLMLRWAAIFLVISIIAAILGFGGIATASAGIAKLLFYVFITLCVVALVIGLLLGRGFAGR